MSRTFRKLGLICATFDGSATTFRPPFFLPLPPDLASDETDLGNYCCNIAVTLKLMPKTPEVRASTKRLKHPYASIGALTCIAGLLLELGLLLKRRFWRGHSPDARLTVGLLGALLVNLYLIRKNRAVSK